MHDFTFLLHDFKFPKMYLKLIEEKHTRAVK